jgi:predicted AlkP superfamily phosphohydrolase/phosphomutase
VIFRKVIVIGLDGMEPKIVEAMLQAGELPNLQKIQIQGGYARVATTYPAQTPVAWSTFSTGTNPGGHGIFDFLSRDPQTYLPILALSKYEQKNPFIPAKVVNQRRGTAIWDVLTKAGIHSTVIRCPCTYPPDPINGRMIAGVGVPDLRGSLGMGTYYTSDPAATPGQSEKLVIVEAEHGSVNTHLIGPRNPKSRQDITLPVLIKLNPEIGTAQCFVDGQSTSLELTTGKWSDWLKVKFKTGVMQTASGMLRFYLRQVAPGFEMYASPINFDPTAPLYPISAPPEYAGELHARLGGYYTLGMAEDHDGLINGRFDEAGYLDQCDLVVRDRRRMMLSELDRFSEGFFFCLYDTPDRLAHMFWRFREIDHPANDKPIQVEFRNAIEEHYRNLDGIIGKTAKYADDQTLMIVLSDHGMNSFQRGLNLNTWLYEHGFLALKDNLHPGEADGDFFLNVDWNRTKAYALGLGGIFLNLRGREANGILKVDEAASTASEIRAGLTGLVDGKNGKIAIQSVSHRDELYRGPYSGEAPDLLVNFNPGFRVSWGTPLGGVPAGLFEDNVKRWGGDHVIDPLQVPGVLFVNRKFRSEATPSLVDLAPTILGALGSERAPAMEGIDLLK